MIISIIAAVAENYAIGKDNDLIWSLPKDMKYFMQTTTNHNILMGRLNYISIPEKYRPFKNRTNIIITRQNKFKAEGCFVANSIEDGIEIARKNNEKELFIIGGGQIYKEAIEKNIVDKLYITWVHHKFDAHTFFPEIDLNKWSLVSSKRHEKDEKHQYAYTICVYDKKKNKGL